MCSAGPAHDCVCCSCGASGEQADLAGSRCCAGLCFVRCGRLGGRLIGDETARLSRARGVAACTAARMMISRSPLIGLGMVLCLAVIGAGIGLATQAVTLALGVAMAVMGFVGLVSLSSQAARADAEEHKRLVQMAASTRARQGRGGPASMSRNSAAAPGASHGGAATSPLVLARQIDLAQHAATVISLLLVAGIWMPLDGWVTGAAGLLLLSRLVQQLEYFSHLRAVSTSADPCDGSVELAGLLAAGLVCFHSLTIWAVWDVGGSEQSVATTALIPVVGLGVVWLLWATGWTSSFVGAWHELVREQVVAKQGLWAVAPARAEALQGIAVWLAENGGDGPTDPESMRELLGCETASGPNASEVRRVTLWRRLVAAVGMTERGVGGFVDTKEGVAGGGLRDWRPLYAGAGWGARFWRLMLASAVGGGEGGTRAGAGGGEG